MTQNRADTIVSRLRDLAEADPDKSAYVFISQNLDTTHLSRKQLWDQARRFAARLRSYGIKKGDVVCNTLKNSRVRLITDFGIISAGATPLHGQILLCDGQDIFGSLRHSKCKMIITADTGPAYDLFKSFVNDEDRPKSNNNERLTESFHPVKCAQSPNLYSLLSIVTNTHEDIDAFCRQLEQETDQLEESVTSQDEAYIMTTSGSTGYSKLVPRNHWELLTIATHRSLITIPSDIYYCDRPLGWSGGFPFFYLKRGLTTYTQEQLTDSPRRSVEDLWALLLEEGVNFGNLLASEILLLEKKYDNKQFHQRLRLLCTGGQPTRKEIFRAVGKITDTILIIYGSTEMGLPTVGVIDQHSKETTKDFYCGKVLGYHLRIFDEKSGKVITEPNKFGTIHIKGPTILRYFVHEEDSTQNAFTDDGYYNSGDIGYIDENNDLHVVGRTNDVISHGPYVVYPSWLEERIKKCPGVATAVVVGIPHPVLNEQICACVVRETNSKLTEEELTKFCKAIFLLKSSELITPVPEKIIFLESFPVNINEKIDRKELKRIATVHFKL